MKKIYISFFFILSASVSFAQWTVLSTGVSNTLRSPYFVNGQDGIVVGEAISPFQSPILKTIDGGATWSSKVSGTTNALRAVHFVDANTAFIVGFGGTVLKSIDAGETWSSISIGTAMNLRSLDFPSSDIGYIAGDSGKVLKSVDGGNTWTKQSTQLDATQSIVNIRFVNTEVGYATAGTGFVNGAVIKTTDGGTTWTTVYTNTQGLLGLAVIDENTALAGGGDNTAGFQFIVRTTDGGTTWTEVYDGASLATFRGAAFISPTTGWFAGDVGTLIKTEDGGTTWTDEVVTTNGLLGIQFPNSDTGYAVGALGTIIKYAVECPTLPAIGSIVGSTTVCSGTSYTYSISPVAGADVYTWSVPSGSTFTGSDTIITVTFDTSSGDISVAAINSCDTSTAILSITVNPAPAIPIITFNSGVLSSSSSAGNQWYLNGTAIPGATDQTYTPTQNGTYTVTVTDINGCSSTSAPFEVIGVGINEIATDQISVYPNPFDLYTIVNVSKTTSIENGRIIITDIEGKVVKSIENIHDGLIISRDKLSSGIYFYRLFDNNGNMIHNGKLVAR